MTSVPSERTEAELPLTGWRLRLYAVIFENDTRARIKKDINLALGSSYVEEKSYQDYGSGAGA